MTRATTSDLNSIASQEFVHVSDEFKPSPWNLIAGLIIGVPMLGVGLLILYLIAKGPANNELPFWDQVFGMVCAIVVGLSLAIGGAYIIKWIWSLYSLRVQVAQDGFTVFRGANASFFAWDKILTVQETIVHYTGMYQLYAAVFPKLPKDSRNFLVTRNDGESFAWDANSIRRNKTLASLIRQNIDGQNIPWEIVDEYRSNHLERRTSRIEHT